MTTPCSNQSSMLSLKEFLMNQETSMTPSASPASTPALQFYNLRLTERLHRYRSLRRQWQEISTIIPHESVSRSKCPSPTITNDFSLSEQNPSIELKVFTLNDQMNPTTSTITTILRERNERSNHENDLLNNRIQNDLFELRRMIQVQQKKSRKPRINSHRSNETLPKTTSIVGKGKKSISSAQEHLPINGKKLLNQMKINHSSTSASTVLQSIRSNDVSSSLRNGFDQTNQQSRTQNKSTIFNRTLEIYRQRASFDSTVQGTSPFKTNAMHPPRSTQSFHFPTTRKNNKKYLPQFKRATLLSPIQSSVFIEEPIRLSYTFAGPTSSLVPRQNYFDQGRDSALPILLTSTTCLGNQTRPNSNMYDSMEHEESLPFLSRTFSQRNDSKDYAILIEQLDHIRTKMPKASFYERFTRITS